jgi:hypothetical protein
MLYVEFPFKFEENSKYFDPDKLHFSKEGYNHLGKFLADPAKKILKV